MSTESELHDWREGQTNAERLCAGILTIHGYTDVDPQAPLGGPDEKKDLLSRRDGKKFVGAVYFPSTHQTYGAIRKKFEDDREGVDRHAADGFVFFVNQRLTLSERSALHDLGGSLDEIYHLERLRLALDSPQGYGLRLEFLRRAMTVEEQISFFSTLQQGFVEKQLADSRRVETKVDEILERTGSVLDALGVERGPSSLQASDVIGASGESMADLTVAKLQLLHRAITDDATVPGAIRGVLRGVTVWIGDPANPTYEPPPPDTVVGRLVELLSWWNTTYPQTRHAEISTVVAELARLHHGLVAIHPFLDGNGRLARFVTDQAAIELLGRGVSRELTEDHAQYFTALRAADGGDLGPLERLISAALE